MDITKLVFNTIDVAFDRRQNRNIKLNGAENVIVTKDVLYSLDDPQMCLLDFYFIPKSQGLYPVMFNIHGGGFVAGGKEHRRTLCTWLATLGFFVINANYGLSPECSFPTPLYHLIHAMSWVKKYAEIMRLDLSKVAVYGDSSGAYYASMLSAICLSDELKNIFEVCPEINFSAAVLNCGLYDIEYSLKQRMLLHLNKRIFTSYTGIKESEFESYKYKKYCSPIPFIGSDYPPTFLFYADKDIFCNGQADKIIDALDKSDVYYESYHSTSLIRNHCFSLEWTSKEAKESNALLETFLKKFMDNSLPEKMSLADSPVRCKQE